LPERDFEKLLLEAIDDALSSLGETPKHAIYYHLEKSFNVKKQEIPYRGLLLKRLRKSSGWEPIFLKS